MKIETGLPLGGGIVWASGHHGFGASRLRGITVWGEEGVGFRSELIFFLFGNRAHCHRADDIHPVVQILGW